MPEQTTKKWAGDSNSQG